MSLASSDAREAFAAARAARPLAADSVTAPLTAPVVLPRSTIPINPFSQLCRRFHHSRAGAGQLQLFAEVLQCLDDYIGAFTGDGSVPSVGDPLSPMSPNVSQERLMVITSDLDNTVAEVIDRFPEFRQCLTLGAYGPFFIPTSSQIFPVDQRFSAYEPSYAELTNGQWWALRLRKDLHECLPQVRQDEKRLDVGAEEDPFASSEGTYTPLTEPTSSSAAYDSNSLEHALSGLSFHDRQAELLVSSYPFFSFG